MMAQHLAESLVFLLVLLGPLPLAVAVSNMVPYRQTGRCLAERALVVILSWCALQTALGVVLGAAGRLAETPLLLSEALLLLAGLAVRSLCGRHIAPSSPQSEQTAIRWAGNLHSLFMGGLGCLALALAWWSSTQPIDDPDSLAFHLPAIADWYQTGSLTTLDQYWFFSRYPSGLEVLSALFLFPFKEDFLVALPNLIAWALLGLAVYCIAVDSGADRLQSLSAGALVLSLPSMVAHVNTIHNDIALAAFFMSGLYVALQYAATGCPAYLGLTLGALGLLMGVKTSGLVYGALIVVPLAAWRIGLRLRKAAVSRPADRSRCAPVVAAAGGVCLLLTGGFWYLRNLIELGNPLGHATVQVGDFVLFPGRLDAAHFRRTTIASLFEVGNADHWRILTSEVYQELHLPFLVLLLMALLAIPALALKKKPVPNRRLSLLLALSAATAVLYTVTPYSGDNGQNQWQITPFIGQALRYAFPFCAALGVAAAAGATALRIPGSILAVIAMGSLALRLNEGRMLPLLVAWVVLWALLRLLPRRAGRAVGTGRIWVIALIAASLGVFVQGGFTARRMRDTNRARMYGPIDEVLATRLPPGAPVGHFMSHRCYLLYGKDLSRKVVYVPLDREKPDEWAPMLRERDVSVFAIGPLGPSWRNSRVLRKMDALDSPFTCILRTDPATYPVLYELKR